MTTFLSIRHCLTAHIRPTLVCGSPYQHLMRQPLVLQNLLELTRPEHPTHADLQAALERVKVVVVAVDQKKQDYEQRAKLLAVAGRMRGTLSDEIVQPHRYVMREGELLEITRQSAPFASKYTSTSDPAGDTHGEGEPTGNEPTTARGANGAPRYGLLCNDSFWYCELLRGNRYKLLHVFHFAPSWDGKEKTPRSADAQSPAHIASGAGETIWLMDAHLRVQLQPMSGVHGSCASEWLASAMEVGTITVRDRLESLGTSSYRVAGDV